MTLTTIFYCAEEFCKVYEQIFKKKALKSKSKNKGGRPSKMQLSEIITICIYFHHSGYRTFKWYYQKHVCGELKTAFKNLVSYNRFVEIMQEVAPILALFAMGMNSTNVTGISFIDSLAIKVCHNLRIPSHKVFDGIAKRGKTSMGWFFGFKLHFVINHLGEILSFYITPGNVDDRNFDVMDKLSRKLWGKLFGDRGYISQKLFLRLWQKGIGLVTSVKSNMKNKLVPMFDKLILRKRNVIESTGNLLKNTHQIEHSRHRSVSNFFTNAFSAVSAYVFHPNKPSIGREFLALVENQC
jgi:hypothetical protein